MKCWAPGGRGRGLGPVAPGSRGAAAGGRPPAPGAPRGARAGGSVLLYAAPPAPRASTLVLGRVVQIPAGQGVCGGGAGPQGISAQVREVRGLALLALGLRAPAAAGPRVGRDPPPH